MFVLINFKTTFILSGSHFTDTIGFCLHVRGVKLFRCFEDRVDSQNKCEQFCTSHGSCVGYYYRSDIGACHIIPTDGNCPSEFQTLTGEKATSQNDLKAKDDSNWVCSVKNSGKFNHLINSYLFYLSMSKCSYMSYCLLRHFRGRRNRMVSCSRKSRMHWFGDKERAKKASRQLC